VYEASLRRPYVVSGVFPQRLRVESIAYPERIRKRLAGSLASWRQGLATVNPDDIRQIAAIKEIIKIYEGELDHFSSSSK
jgi:hypothetical protein